MVGSSEGAVAEDTRFSALFPSLRAAIGGSVANWPRYPLIAGCSSMTRTCLDLGLPVSALSRLGSFLHYLHRVLTPMPTANDSKRGSLETCAIME